MNRCRQLTLSIPKENRVLFIWNKKDILFRQNSSAKFSAGRLGNWIIKTINAPQPGMIFRATIQTLSINFSPFWQLLPVSTDYRPQLVVWTTQNFADIIINAAQNRPYVLGHTLTKSCIRIDCHLTPTLKKKIGIEQLFATSLTG